MKWIRFIDQQPPHGTLIMAAWRALSGEVFYVPPLVWDAGQAVETKKKDNWWTTVEPPVEAVK